MSVNVVTKLSEIIDSLGNPGALNGKLVDLANQHKQRGTTRAHFDVSILYKIVGKLLITYPMNCRTWPPCCLDFWLPLSAPPSQLKPNKPGHPPCKASTPSSKLLLEIQIPPTLQVAAFPTTDQSNYITGVCKKIEMTSN